MKKMAKRGIVIDADDVTMDQVQYRLKMQVLSGASTLSPIEGAAFFDVIEEPFEFAGLAAVTK